MDIVQQLHALKPDEPIDEVAKDVDQIRQASPGITDEEIYAQGQALVSGQSQKPSAPPAAPADPIAQPPQPPIAVTPAAPVAAPRQPDEDPILEEDMPRKLGGRDYAIAALQGLAGVGDAVVRGFGGGNSDHLKAAMASEKENQDYRLNRQKIISDRMKEKRIEKRDDEALHLANLKTQAETMKTTMDAMRGEGKDKFDMEEKLRGGFSNSAKTFSTVRDQYGVLQAAAKDPSAAGDLALIFAYMKLVDPGSTVREGEFANAQNSAGVEDRVRNMYNNALNGQRFAPNVREDFVNQAGKLFDSHKKTFDATKGLYDKLATSYDLDPKRVTEIVVGESSGGRDQEPGQGNSGGQRTDSKPKQTLTEEDADALKLANANPRDPRASEIRKRLGR